jgi:hypothetical protein
MATGIRRLLAVATLALGVYGIASTGSRDLFENAHPGRGEDMALYLAVEHRVRAGQTYYDSAEHELRARGYPMSSRFNWRLPTLAWLCGALPSDGAAQALLVALAAATLLAWFEAIRRARGARVAAAAATIIVGLVAWPLFDVYLVHETWAGVLIALSIACAGLEWPAASVLAGAAALAIRELSLPYVVIALWLAFRARRARETLAWSIVLAGFAAGSMLHGSAVAAHVAPSDRMQTATWLAFGGWWFVLKTALMNVWLILLPQGLIALVWPISLYGLVAWSARDPRADNCLGRRLGLTSVAYVAAFCFFGQPFNYLWGLIYAGLVPLGLLELPRVIHEIWERR